MFLYQRLAWGVLIGVIVAAVIARFTVGLLLSDNTAGYVTVPLALVGAFTGAAVVWSRAHRD